MHRPCLFIRGMGLREALLLALGLTAWSGCGQNRPISLRVPAATHVPVDPVMVFLVDGLDREVFNELLAAGALPNIDRHLVRRGVTVENAVTCVPSITYAAKATMLTGCYPGHNGILGNQWFDRTSLISRSYSFIDSYRAVDRDLRVPTLYEVLDDKVSVSVRCAVRRGVKHEIHMGQQSAVCHFFGWNRWGDGLVARAIEAVPRIAQREGRWPDLIVLYFNGLDDDAHRHGSDSAYYRTAIGQIDFEIGKVCNALIDANVMDATTLVLVADHGHEPLDPKQFTDVNAWLRKRYGWRIHNTRYDKASEPERRRHFESIDAVTINEGNRRFGLYLPGNHGWPSAPDAARCCEILGDGLAELPAVFAGACRLSADQVWIRSRDGEATVTRRHNDSRFEYRYDAISGDPLGYRSDPKTAAFAGEGWHDSRAWLGATAASRCPDAVSQIVEAFDSPRSPDILLFAREGWDFEGGHRGGHGSIVSHDMRIPMIFAGAGMPANRRIAAARMTDVAPTIAELLAGRERLDRFGSIDGISLVPQLQKAKEALVSAR